MTRSIHLAGLGLASLIGGGSAFAADPPASPALVRPSAESPATVADWLTRNTSIAPDTVVSIGDEYIVAVLSSRPVDPARPEVLRLEIRAELTDPDVEAARLLRSLSASLEVNCKQHTSHFIEVRTFTAPNLTGVAQISRPTEGWVPNPRGSYFEDVDTAVCTANAPRPLAAARLKTAAAATPPVRVAAQSAPLALRPAQSADAPAPTQPAPRPKPKPVETAVARPAHPGAQAQIAAANTEAKATAALAELRAARPAWMSGLSTRIERIERDGVAYYRALVFGFTPPADAAGFCRQLTASGRACLVR